MRYIGRFLGAVTGALFMVNIFTTAAGFLLGWLFDWLVGFNRLSHERERLNQDLCLSFVRLAASLASIGHAPQLAWQAFRPQLGGTTADLVLAEQIFQYSLRHPNDMAALADVIIAQVNGNPEQLTGFIEAFQAMSQRQGYSQRQRRLLGHLAGYFDVDLPPFTDPQPQPQTQTAHHQQAEEPVFTKRQPDPEPEQPRQAHPHKSDALAGRDPYTVLGVSASATPAQIKSAYRKLVFLYHPDKLHGQGASPKVLHEAEEKMRVYNAAYDMLAKRQKE